MRFVLAPVAALVAALFLLPATAFAAPAGGLQIGPVGNDATTLSKELDAAKALNAKIVRTTFQWDVAEPVQGSFDAGYLAKYDALQAEATKRGLKVITTVVGTPCWASSAPDKTGCTSTTTPSSVSVWQPADGSSVSGVFATVAQHSTAAVTGIEVWNEPDQANELYFRGPDKSTKYVAVLQTAYRAIKGVNPNITVLGGALVGYNGVFLQNMYAKGAKGYFDALDVHYYDLVLASLRSIRKVMKANGDSSPVWLGEFGFNSCAPERRQGPHVCLTRANQARALGDVLGALRKTSWVKAAVVYSYDDQPGKGAFKFGLLSTSGARKPAFNTVRRAFSGRYTTHKLTLRVRRERGRVRVNVSGPFADIYTLSARVGGQLRFKETFRLGPKATFRQLLPAALGSRNVKIRVTYPWTGRSIARTLR